MIDEELYQRINSEIKDFLPTTQRENQLWHITLLLQLYVKELSNEIERLKEAKQ